MKPPRKKPQRTILIVDDFAADRALFRRLLAKDTEFDYTFLEAEDGAQALEICRSQTPDCVLLDYELPDMNGAEILQKIVEQNGVSRIPVVMLSGGNNLQIAVDALKHGAQDYLVKDRQRDSDDLQRAVGNAIEKVALERARLTAEDRLRLYEKVILNTKDAVIITEAEPIDEPGPRIVYVNPAFTAQTGYSAEEAIGQTPRMLQGPKTDRAPLDEIYSNLKNWQPTRVEMTNYRKDGTEFEVEFEINAVADDSGWFTHWVSVQRDVTERKAREARLRESEAKYRSLFDSIDEGFCVIEVIFDDDEKPVDYCFIETNPAFMRQTGFQEMNDRCISELLPNHEQSWFDIYGNIVLTGEAARFENHAEEIGRWFDVFAFRFGQPEKHQVAVVFNDITERKRREMNLAFLADLQRDYAPLSSDLEIMEMTGARIIEYSKSSHCLFVEINQDTEEATVLYDRHAEDETNLAGVYRIADFHTEEERARLMMGEPLVINDVRDGQRSMEAIESFEAMGIGSLVNALYVSDGRWKFALTILRAQPCEWRDDEVELFSELASRIYLRMERARAKSSLRESEERFRNLFDSIDEGFCTIEVIFDEHEKAVDFRFIELNPAFAKQTGMANAIGETARELFPGLNEIWYERYGQVAISGEALRFEDEVASLDRVFDIFASRIGSESNPRVAIVFTDITQRKRAEAEREEMLGREQVLRRGAEDANRAKDEFLAMLSHELRSPLNVILGWTQILEDRDFDRDTTQQAMAIIARNVRLQNALIEDLLDVSRIISGKMQLETENVSLVALVRECLDAALPSAEKKAIALESNLDENAGEMLGDKHCLQQIFGNLLTNAIKFTPENGRIEVTLKRIGDRAQLSIEDSGIGIAPELLPQIFERFKQADASSKRQFGGLGLGLTIVKHLAQLHGGDVSAHSDGEGRGATFTVELPLAVKAVAKNENAEESRARENLKPLAGLRVLVVDDDRDALELMQFVLQHKGATVSCASSASAALRKLDGESFDLLISDLGMPHMDGFDLIRAVRANGHADLPAIALTGYVSAEDRERVVRAGFQAHLPKPVNVENLFAAALNFARK